MLVVVISYPKRTAVMKRRTKPKVGVDFTTTFKIRFCKVGNLFVTPYRYSHCISVTNTKYNKLYRN